MEQRMVEIEGDKTKQHLSLSSRTDFRQQSARPSTYTVPFQLHFNSLSSSLPLFFSRQGIFLQICEPELLPTSYYVHILCERYHTKIDPQIYTSSVHVGTCHR